MRLLLVSARPASDDFDTANEIEEAIEVVGASIVKQGLRVYACYSDTMVAHVYVRGA